VQNAFNVWDHSAYCKSAHIHHIHTHTHAHSQFFVLWIFAWRNFPYFQFFKCVAVVRILRNSVVNKSYLWRNSAYSDFIGVAQFCVLFATLRTQRNSACHTSSYVWRLILILWVWRTFASYSQFINHTCGTLLFILILWYFMTHKITIISAVHLCAFYAILRSITDTCGATLRIVVAQVLRSSAHSTAILLLV